MILGVFSLSVYTTIHVIISLIAIAAGIAFVFYGLLAGRRSDGLAFIFLLFTILTSLTGFGFPIATVTPGIVIGILSLILLLLTVLGFYTYRLNGAWRWIFVVTAMMALWFNLFVLIVQSFQKITTLNALAPTQSEPPFLIAQVAVLAVMVALAIVALRRFHPPVQG